ncbi:N-acetylmuramoyl-L-alanine amidase [Rubrobacter radiotolerans]|uniref:N-acetylmuramoyl-L-alanine amidase n=1 Tax=Rubrobacter radiotolerans TaxID=42256 RepID=A0A023WZ71_RUBRA|nr:N-acetylmuramoyl-L-alanine amidase [Rubrobacter radiotolerans]AHY45517.1 N-acetylmuramoyl-L-alanine amidase [Rubrobacter radiotolerans]MDX5892930.1 N-acetylmuramoyl-L-alanine amidase [Rubrobacter radiotolerans]SMC02765.1 N-acetylmuramoyl-L-alanine amidase [Rubrobacter radiotolerans DSM 5868]
MCEEKVSVSRYGMDRREFLKLGGVGVFGAALLGVTLSGRAFAQSEASLPDEFKAASGEYEVPLEVLLAVGYVSTRWTMPPPSAGEFEPGDIHGMGGYGVMALSEDPESNMLKKAAEITNIPEEKLKTDRASNILGAAAVLAELRRSSGGDPADLDSWYDAVAAYGGGPLYANQVFQTLKEGASQPVAGEEFGFGAQDVEGPQPLYSTAATPDYPSATWYGAYSGNYTQANRPSSNKIDKVVVHVMQGSYSSAINWFKDSRAGVSCHYNIRSSDGAIGQSVQEKDIAWHAGYWSTNQTSVGIEHEGYVSDPGRWFTTAMYESSAKLTAYLCKKYGIPIDRNHIIGHNQVPGCSSGSGGGGGCHTDPGSGWDWTRYMNLVKQYAGGSTQQEPQKSSVYTQVVDNSTADRFKTNTGWSVSSWNSQKYGADYRYANPVAPGSTPYLVRYKVNVPQKGKYAVHVRNPAGSGYNPKALYRVRAAGGIKTRLVNQRINGGKWVGLGTFNFNAGEQWAVEISRKSPEPGYVIADAIRIVHRP